MAFYSDLTSADSAQERNHQAIFGGKWRREPFSRRKYERIDDYVFTDNIADSEKVSLRSQLVTPLEGYFGPALNFDDNLLTEEWMVAFKDTKSKTNFSEDDVIRIQLEGVMELLKSQVQDRVCTEQQVFRAPPLLLGRDIKEIPVWGIDCYTRRMIEMAIEDRLLPVELAQIAAQSVRSKNATSLSDTRARLVKEFVEKRLLPAINAQEPELAHNITNALKFILQASYIVCCSCTVMFDTLIDSFNNVQSKKTQVQ